MSDIQKPQINWFNDPNFTRNLREIFKSVSRAKEPFKTIRLGDKWANTLSPDIVVEITIGNLNESAEVIGECAVCSVLKTKIMWLREEDLRLNLGAKAKQNVLIAMQKVYAPQQVSMDSIITVIELLPIKKEV